VTSNIGLTDFTIRSIRLMSDEEAASVLDGRIRSLERAYKRSFVERGLCLLEMEQRELWAIVDGGQYQSLNEYICSAATHSRADCFAALRAVKELREVPVDQLLDMPRCNVQTLVGLSSEVRRQPEVVKAAQVMSGKDFIRTIENGHANQHIESKVTKTLHFESSAWKIIEEALERAKAVEGSKTIEDVVEEWAAGYAIEVDQ
jgi:hypothetical protein